MFSVRFMVPLKTHTYVSMHEHQGQILYHGLVLVQTIEKQDSNGYESIHKHFTNAEGPQQKRDAVGHPDSHLRLFYLHTS